MLVFCEKFNWAGRDEGRRPGGRTEDEKVRRAEDEKNRFASA